MKNDAAPAGCSVIILSYNGGAAIRETLTAVLSQETRRAVEVLVIDSGSSDRSIEYLRSLPIAIKEIPNESFGHGATRNLGARLASHPLLVFMSQDAAPTDARWLENLLAALVDPKVGGVYGRQAPRNTHICERFFLEKTYPSVAARRSLGPVQRPALKDLFFSNVNSACRREVWEQCPFDESLVMSEDQQWAKDVMGRGYEIVYEPQAAVYHSHNYGIIGVFKRYFDSGASLRHVTGGKTGLSWRHNCAYVLEELRLAVREESLLRAPYVLLYEAARMAGYSLGRLEPWIPLWVKKRLSSNPAFWSRSSRK